MGSFANALFTLLFGWVRSLASGIWGALSGGNGNSFLAFIGNNWVIIVAVLCAVGLVTDLIVYLTRWRTYRVWASFFRKMKRNRTEADESISAVLPVDASYNWGEPEPDRSGEELPPEEAPAEAPVYQPYSAVEPMQPAYAQPEPLSSRERMERAIQPRRRRARLSRLLSDEQDDFIEAPQNLIDPNEAYRKPVYPKKWRNEDDKDE